MTFRAKYTDAQRQAALQLVDKLERATGKSRGTVAKAATQLGLHPSIVAHWVSVARTNKDEPRPAEPSREPAPNGITGLLWCAFCERAMVCARTREGELAYACAGPCQRRSIVRSRDVERVIGQMILKHLSVARRPSPHSLTIAGAAARAPLFVDRIVVGAHATALRVRWRLAPLPAGPNARKPNARNATDRPA